MKNKNNYFQFLKARQKTIVIFISINIFILFINILHIEVPFKSSTPGCGQWNNKFLTSEFVYNEEENYGMRGFVDINLVNKKKFWPFVSYFEYGGNAYPLGDCQGTFKGIFVYYDISEFIAYSFFFFLFMYFKWSSMVVSERNSIEGNEN